MCRKERGKEQAGVSAGGGQMVEGRMPFQSTPVMRVHPHTLNPEKKLGIKMQPPDRRSAGQPEDLMTAASFSFYLFIFFFFFLPPNTSNKAVRKVHLPNYLVAVAGAEAAAIVAVQCSAG